MIEDPDLFTIPTNFMTCTVHGWQRESLPQHAPCLVTLWLVGLLRQGMWASLTLLPHAVCLHLKAAVVGSHCVWVQQQFSAVAAVCRLHCRCHPRAGVLPVTSQSCQCKLGV